MLYRPLPFVALLLLAAAIASAQPPTSAPDPSQAPAEPEISGTGLTAALDALPGPPKRRTRRLHVLRLAGVLLARAHFAEIVSARLCTLDRSTAAAREEIARQRAIGRESGMVDAAALHAAGEQIVEAKSERATIRKGLRKRAVRPLPCGGRVSEIARCLYAASDCRETFQVFDAAWSAAAAMLDGAIDAELETQARADLTSAELEQAAELALANP